RNQGQRVNRQRRNRIGGPHFAHGLWSGRRISGQITETKKAPEQSGAFFMIPKTGITREHSGPQQMGLSRRPAEQSRVHQSSKSKRSAFITFAHALAKSFTNF